MKLSKEAKNAILMALDDVANDYEYGLPIYDEGKMALMREAIDEVIEGFES